MYLVPGLHIIFRASASFEFVKLGGCGSEALSKFVISSRLSQFSFGMIGDVDPQSTPVHETEMGELPTVLPRLPKSDRVEKRRRFSDPEGRFEHWKQTEEAPIQHLIRSEMHDFVTNALKPVFASVNDQLIALQNQQADTRTGAQNAMNELNEVIGTFRDEQIAVQQKLVGKEKFIRTHKKQIQHLHDIQEQQHSTMDYVTKTVDEFSHGVTGRLGEAENITAQHRRDIQEAQYHQINSQSCVMEEGPVNSATISEVHPNGYQSYGQDDRKLPHIPKCNANPYEVPRSLIDVPNLWCTDQPSVHENQGVPTAEKTDGQPFVQLNHPQSMLNMPKLAPPPSFDPPRYYTWKKNLMYWRDLYSYIPDAFIIATMGLHATDQLNRIMITYTKETRRTSQNRCLRELLCKLDSCYEATAIEREMSAMDRWMGYKKAGSESIQIFRNRFEGLLASMEKTKSNLSSDVIFLRALRALQLTEQNKTTLLMSLEALGLSHTMENLKRCSVRIFGTYKDRNAVAASGKGVDKTFVTVDSSRDWTDDEEEELDEEVYFVKRRKRLRTAPVMNKCRLNGQEIR